MIVPLLTMNGTRRDKKYVILNAAWIIWFRNNDWNRRTAGFFFGFRIVFRLLVNNTGKWFKKLSYLLSWLFECFHVFSFIIYNDKYFYRSSEKINDGKVCTYHGATIRSNRRWPENRIGRQGTDTARCGSHLSPRCNYRGLGPNRCGVCSAGQGVPSRQLDGGMAKLQSCDSLKSY